MIEEPKELSDFLAPYPEQVRQDMLLGRQILLNMLKPVGELWFDATSAVCSGFSYTGEVRDNFVNLAAFAKHVTLVFAWGVNLNDPDCRLRGEGSQVRHMRLASAQDLFDPYVVDLIRQASENAIKPARPFEPETVIQMYKGPKRRPKPEI